MKKQKKENGIQDTMGSLFVLVFIFGMLLCYIGFSKSVQMKLQCDNIAKKYLYRMEAAGYMTSADLAAMQNDYEALGATVNCTGTSFAQVPYGSKVVLKAVVTFPNPLTENLNLTIFNVDPVIDYEVYLEATAKW